MSEHDSQPDDSLLLSHGLQGDAEALNTLFSRYQRLLHALACRVLGGPEDAQDVVQNCLLQAFTKLKQFNHEGTFRSWLVRILVNEAITVRRRRKGKLASSIASATDEKRGDMMDRLPSTRSDPEQALVRKQFVAALQGEVSRLSTPLRSAVLLCALEEYSAAEASEMLRVPQSTIRARLFRARKQLAAFLDSDTPTDPNRT
jgi:RNA polymerase sigma-70 factor, ECF subfamily